MSRYCNSCHSFIPQCCIKSAQSEGPQIDGVRERLDRAKNARIAQLEAEMKRLRGALEQCKVEYWKRCSTGSGRITSLTVSEFDAFIDAALKGEI